MNYLFHIALILFAHFISILLVANRVNIMFAVIVALLFIVLMKKRMKELPSLLSILPVGVTGYYVGIQYILLLGAIFNYSLLGVLISWAGIIIVEYIRMVQLPTFFQNQNSLQLLQEELDKVNMSFREVRSQRHDFLKHVSVVEFLLSKEEQAEAKDYFASLLEEYQRVNGSIQGEEGHMAAILLDKLQVANTHKVELKYELGIPLSGLPMDAVDQIKLIANLLDNAIDAALDCQVDIPRVTVTTHTYGGIYIFEVSNHAHFNDPKVLDHLFDKYEITSKSGNHEGLGTFVIANVVKKYNGKLTFRYKDSILSIRIKFPIIV